MASRDWSDMRLLVIRSGMCRPVWEITTATHNSVIYAARHSNTSPSNLIGRLNHFNKFEQLFRSAAHKAHLRLHFYSRGLSWKDLPRLAWVHGIITKGLRTYGANLSHEITPQTAPVFCFPFLKVMKMITSWDGWLFGAQLTTWAAEGQIYWETASQSCLAPRDKSSYDDLNLKSVLWSICPLMDERFKNALAKLRPLWPCWWSTCFNKSLFTFLQKLTRRSLPWVVRSTSVHGHTAYMHTYTRKFK